VLLNRIILVFAILAGLIVGCDRNPSGPTGRVVSLSPAATDLLIAMDAGDLLAGVSTFDTDARVKHLPRVGDYENIDWERLAGLRPSFLIVQARLDKLPPGLLRRAGEMKIEVVSCQIDTLIDIFTEADKLGRAVGRADEGRKLSESLREPFLGQLMGASERQPVKTLIVVSDDGLSIAGGRTFLDDVLKASGGFNVAAPYFAGYKTIDKEVLAELAPDAIIQLMPDATPQQQESARQFWARLPDVPAVRSGRITMMTDAWVLRPGSTVIALNRKMSEFLHPPEKP
jgi:ABC-type Fe3+-hydroxamate transport system substrate-binding protein